MCVSVSVCVCVCVCAIVRAFPFFVCVCHPCTKGLSNFAGGMAVLFLAMPMKLWNMTGREIGRSFPYLQETGTAWVTDVAACSFDHVIILIRYASLASWQSWHVSDAVTWLPFWMSLETGKSRQSKSSKPVNLDITREKGQRMGEKSHIPDTH